MVPCHPFQVRIRVRMENSTWWLLERAVDLPELPPVPTRLRPSVYRIKDEYVTKTNSGVPHRNVDPDLRQLYHGRPSARCSFRTTGWCSWWTRWTRPDRSMARQEEAAFSRRCSVGIPSRRHQ